MTPSATNLITPAGRDDVKVLEAVDVKVDGGVEGGQKVGDVGHRFDPWRPRPLVLHEVDPEKN